MHFWRQLLCSSSTSSTLMSVLKSEEPLYSRAVVKINQLFQENILTNSCFQPETVDEKANKTTQTRNKQLTEASANMEYGYLPYFWVSCWDVLYRQATKPTVGSNATPCNRGTTSINLFLFLITQTSHVIGGTFAISEFAIFCALNSDSIPSYTATQFPWIPNAYMFSN